MSDSFTPHVEPLPHQHGVRIVDPVEDVQFPLYTLGDTAVIPMEMDSVPWCFPIDTAVKLTTNKIQLPHRASVYVRQTDGEMIAHTAGQQPLRVTQQPSIVEFANIPIKLYLNAESPINVENTDGRITVEFPDSASIHAGLRSIHDQPARTLTTTREPEDLMQVVSEFGAALKTTTCERSFPTLQGHPPLIEFGETVSIPGGTRRPKTGVAVEIPPEIKYIYPSASLAYYLGAELVPAESARLTTTSGTEYHFGMDDFAREATRFLQHVFTLDCLTRVEGYYPVDLYERQQAVKKGIELDWEEVYQQPLAAQLRTYLQVPFEPVADIAPKWRLTADIVSEMNRAPVLPHLANELANVRLLDETQRLRDTTAESPPDESTATTKEHSDNLFRDSMPLIRSESSNRFPDEDVTHETDASGQPVSTEDVLRVPPADSLTQTYIGEGFPLNANKGSRRSYERQLELQAKTVNHISVSVVCNDPEMVDELAVGDYYGTRDIFDFDVDLHTQLTRSELRQQLETDSDLLHYIGHVDSRGLQASDGYLDASTLNSVGVSAFVLNGCRSFRQGQALVDAGAIAGIVTLESVHNELATDVGTNVARLLNRGWTLDTAIEVIKDDTLVGRHYIVVGDGSVEIASSDSGIPTLNIITGYTANDSVSVEVIAYPTRSNHLGALYNPFLSPEEMSYLPSGTLNTFTVSEETLLEYLKMETEPVQFEQEQQQTTVSLRWTDEISKSKLREFADST